MCCISTGNERLIHITSPNQNHAHLPQLTQIYLYIYIYIYSFSWAKVMKPFWDRYRPIRFIRLILFYDIYYILQNMKYRENNYTATRLAATSSRSKADGKEKTLPPATVLRSGSIVGTLVLHPRMLRAPQARGTLQVLLPLLGLCQSNLRFHLPPSGLFSAFEAARQDSTFCSIPTTTWQKTSAKSDI